MEVVGLLLLCVATYYWRLTIGYWLLASCILLVLLRDIGACCGIAGLTGSLSEYEVESSKGGSMKCQVRARSRAAVTHFGTSTPYLRTLHCMLSA